MDPYDEDEIGPADTVIRGISRHYVVPDENSGGSRISKMAFQSSSGPLGGLSVDLEALMIADGVDPKLRMVRPQFIGAVYFCAGDARSLDLQIGYHPLPDNPYHGEVWGKGKPSITDSQKKGLLSRSRWYIDVPGVILG